MTTINVEVLFVTTPVDIGATIHAAAAAAYRYVTLCGQKFPHDTPEYRFQEGGKTLEDVCTDCKFAMTEMGMPTDGRAINELGFLLSEPTLLRAVQHLFEAERHITGYAKNCPVCGGTQVDGDEGCGMCSPLWQMIFDAKVINDIANSILLVEDPFEGVPR